MAPRRKASTANSKPPEYNPHDLCHPEEIEAVEAECEEDDKQVENQDLEAGVLSLTVLQHFHNIDACIIGWWLGIFPISGIISRN